MLTAGDCVTFGVAGVVIVADGLGLGMVSALLAQPVSAVRLSTEIPNSIQPFFKALRLLAPIMLPRPMRYCATYYLCKKTKALFISNEKSPKMFWRLPSAQAALNEVIHIVRNLQQVGIAQHGKLMVDSG